MIVGPEDTGVTSPYALAEVLAGRRIEWRRVRDRPRLLETIFGRPYEDILDPSTGSPIFSAFREAWKLRSWFEETSSDRACDSGPSPRSWRIPPEIASLVSARPDAVSASGGWTPPNTSWSVVGRFFAEAAEHSDPVQGAVGNCYLIAALSSVAWSLPYTISHRARPTGTSQPEYTNAVSLHDIGGEHHIEVTSAILVSNATGRPIFARSSEADETWPAIYEKAYAKWSGITTDDRPNVAATAGGSPFVAIEHLTGHPEWHVDTTTMTANEIWDEVRARSSGRRTFSPMAACTMSEMLLAAQGLTYAGTGIVPGHAYSILGWDYHQGAKYIILRNPWGLHEARIGVHPGTVQFYDVSWWRNVDLVAADGIFGLDVDTFRLYFRYIGGCAD